MEMKEQLQQLRTGVLNPWSTGQIWPLELSSSPQGSPMVLNHGRQGSVAVLIAALFLPNFHTCGETCRLDNIQGVTRSKHVGLVQHVATFGCAGTVWCVLGSLYAGLHLQTDPIYQLCMGSILRINPMSLIWPMGPKFGISLQLWPQVSLE